MADHEITRRRFVRDTSLAATALAAGLGGTETIRAGEASDEDAKKIQTVGSAIDYIKSKS